MGIPMGMPLRRGNLACIVGQSSQGKSLLAATVACTVRDNIKQRDGTGNVFVFMTEESVEARQVQMFGDGKVSIDKVMSGTASMERLADNIEKVRGDPVYFIGESATLENLDTADLNRGVLTPGSIAATIQTMIVDGGIMPELIIIDHIHDLASDHSARSTQERHDQVGMDLVGLVKHLSAVCPCLFLCQTTKSVSGRLKTVKDQTPDMYDISYMSSIIQKATYIYGVSWPKSFTDEAVECVNGTFMPGPGLFTVNGAKVRYGRGRGEIHGMMATDERGDWRGILSFPRNQSESARRLNHA